MEDTDDKLYYKKETFSEKQVSLWNQWLHFFSIKIIHSILDITRFIFLIVT